MNPLEPQNGDYVLATKFSDGDPGDPWAVGWYAGIAYGDRHMVHDNDGKNIRPNGYRRVGRITAEVGNWLMANADLLERAPSKINLWGMYDWNFVNARIPEFAPTGRRTAPANSRSDSKEQSAVQRAADEDRAEGQT